MFIHYKWLVMLLLFSLPIISCVSQSTNETGDVVVAAPSQALMEEMAIAGIDTTINAPGILPCLGLLLDDGWFRNYNWTHPLIGSPADNGYVVVVIFSSADSTMLSYTNSEDYVVRVAGIDTLNRVGMFSEYSDWDGSEPAWWESFLNK